MFKRYIIICCTIIFAALHTNMQPPAVGDDVFISYSVDPRLHNVEMFWKDDQQKHLGSIEQLKQWITRQKKQLIFAMNGGMYMEDRSPLGLYIEKGKKLHDLNTRHGEGNFYTMPNGVFYITADKTAGICTTAEFPLKKNISFATQSGPMLVVNGAINTAFKEGSTNLNIRNAVGILPGNKLIFAMSKTPVNFYDMAAYFKRQGCTNALYLDGFVSRTYLPSQNWIQTDGAFGVMIGVSDPMK